MSWSEVVRVGLGRVYWGLTVGRIRWWEGGLCSPGTWTGPERLSWVRRWDSWVDDSGVEVQ